MHGLLAAGLLLSPALAGGVGATTSPRDSDPSAFITLDVPDVGLDIDTRYLTLRIDVYESSDACGTTNVTINGETLTGSGQLSIAMAADDNGDSKNANIEISIEASKRVTPTAEIAWQSDCISSGDGDYEQVLRLRVLSVNGVAVTEADDGDNVAIQFRQTAPAHIVLVDGAASFYQFNDNYFLPARPAAESIDPEVAEANDANDAVDADLVAWENSLAILHSNMALLQHDIRLHERYIAERFGAGASPIVAHDSKHGALRSKINSFFGYIYRKATGNAKSAYGEQTTESCFSLPQTNPASQMGPFRHPHTPFTPASSDNRNEAYETQRQDMRCSSSDDSPPPDMTLPGRDGEERPSPWPPFFRTVTFFAVIALILGYFSHGGKRIKERRESRRERARRYRVSTHRLFHAVFRFLFRGKDDHEKLLAAEAGAAPLSERTSLIGSAAAEHIVTETPAAPEQLPAASFEDEIAQFRAAADMIDRMIVAGEGRSATAQSSEPRRWQQQRDERSSLFAPAAPPQLLAQAPAEQYSQSMPTPQTSRIYGDSDLENAAGDSDFDDTESLPPAYSAEDYHNANLVEAHIVADGFQYRPGSSVR
ncbi:hypothetical protein SEPCBS119000_004888 [Sporothrix epigloea]|uniref:Uncharacterized protein n=1 Tax=Sporothrix epigloea TaxID=1892477 RepID=A0ABP0DUX0_9PEZI